MPRYIVYNKRIISLFEEFREKYSALEIELERYRVKMGAKNYQFSRVFGLEWLIFDSHPGTDWTSRRYSETDFRPKISTKTGRKLYEEFESFRPIKRTALDKLCGYHRPYYVSSRVATGPSFKRLTLPRRTLPILIMEIPEEILRYADFELPDEVDEITSKEYENMRKGKNGHD